MELSPFTATPTRSPQRAAKNLLIVATATLVYVASWTSSAIASDAIETQMTPEERVKSGIDILSDKQRAFLNSWLRQRAEVQDLPVNSSSTTETVTATTANVAAPNNEPGDIEAEIDRRVAEKLSKQRTAAINGEVGNSFEAHIAGNFTGWSGKTVFRLDNGQIWRQRSASNYRHRGEDQQVTFKKNWMGGWEMTVISSDKTVLVRKVR